MSFWVGFECGLAAGGFFTLLMFKIELIKRRQKPPVWKALLLAAVLVLSAGAANAQLVSLSPALVVDCTASPCTIKSVNPIVKSALPSVSIDQTYAGKSLWRNATTSMSDTIADPSVIGNEADVFVCTSTAGDVVTAAAPVLNGTTSISIAPWQCADFQSDGSNFLVLLTWQAGARQRCPSGQQMVSGAPFLCTKN